MTNEQIQQWARASNMATPLYDYQKEQLQAFATLVRNATLEEAAVKCDAMHYEVDVYPAQCAHMIRSLKS